MRKNNKMDMTIAEQMAVVREKMCDEYCKYPAQFADEHDNEAIEQLMEICNFCPLKALGV